METYQPLKKEIKQRLTDCVNVIQVNAVEDYATKFYDAGLLTIGEYKSLLTLTMNKFERIER